LQIDVAVVVVVVVICLMCPVFATPWNRHSRLQLLLATVALATATTKNAKAI